MDIEGTKVLTPEEALHKEKTYIQSQIIKDLCDAGIPYKVITNLDRFKNIPDTEDLFELRFNGSNYVIMRGHTIKLYFGINYKAYDLPAEHYIFTQDFSDAVKVLKEDLNTELYWENPNET